MGKAGHAAYCKQNDINALMVSLGHQGKQVVRLKGGDPLLFGRATEEIDSCRSAGISVEIVPGITSAQGAAASLGVSLTQRSVARRVQFVTGHGGDGRLPQNIDWQACQTGCDDRGVHAEPRKPICLNERRGLTRLAERLTCLSTEDCCLNRATRPTGQALVLFRGSP